MKRLQQAVARSASCCNVAADVIYGIYAAVSKENRFAFNDFIIGDKNARLALSARAKTDRFELSPMESMRADQKISYLNQLFSHR